MSGCEWFVSKLMFFNELVNVCSESPRIGLSNAFQSMAQFHAIPAFCPGTSSQCNMDLCSSHMVLTMSKLQINQAPKPLISLFRKPVVQGWSCVTENLAICKSVEGFFVGPCTTTQFAEPFILPVWVCRRQWYGSGGNQGVSHQLTTSQICDNLYS